MKAEGRASDNGPLGPNQRDSSKALMRWRKTVLSVQPVMRPTSRPSTITTVVGTMVSGLAKDASSKPISFTSRNLIVNLPKRATFSYAGRISRRYTRQYTQPSASKTISSRLGRKAAEGRDGSVDSQPAVAPATDATKVKKTHPLGDTFPPRRCPIIEVVRRTTS